MSADEKTCQKEICRKIWEEKYIPKDEVPGMKMNFGQVIMKMKYFLCRI